MNIVDVVAPLLSITQWVLLIALIGAISIAAIEAQVWPRIRQSLGWLRASRNATAHQAPSLNGQPRLRVASKAEWKLTDPHPGLASYKQRKARGLL